MFEIAGGIVLAVLIFLFLPWILRAALWLFVIAVMGILGLVAYLNPEYWKEMATIGGIIVSLLVIATEDGVLGNKG